MVALQELLNNKYLSNKGTNIIEIENQGSPTGTLNLKDYTNLETLKLYGNNINDETYFSIIQSIPNKDKIKALGFGNNPIRNPRFDYIGANFPNLEWFSLSGDPIDLNISLKGLEKCRKLRDLWIGEGEKKFKDMEYLPVSLVSYNGNGDSQFFKDLKSKSKSYEREKVQSLFEAIRNNDLSLVKKIISEGTNVNARDSGEMTPLHLATIFENKEIVSELLDHQAIPNAKNETGNTPLHFAAEVGNLEILKLLVDKVGNVNVVNEHGWSVLHSAASGIVNEKENWKVINFLVSKGANVEVKTTRGLSVYDVFEKKDWSYAERYAQIVDASRSKK